MGINKKNFVFRHVFEGELREKQKVYNSHIKILEIRRVMYSIGIIYNKYKY